jgi:quinol monooxygenase YgiN
MLTIVATIIAKPGMENALREALLKLVPLSQLEEGCINYDLHEIIDNPGSFVLYENWRDQAALDLHFSLPYSQEFAVQTPHLLAKPLEMIRAQKIYEV